ncbi:anaphase-promoting complex subunit cdc27 [Coemansia sp. RSA 2336]|nr:anaphase-promoting complex subunit cdc27 [Coemansia sp. RSA 2336]
MLGNPSDTRKRVPRTAPLLPQSTTRSASSSRGSVSANALDSKRASEPTPAAEPLTRPQTETTRSHYERLIHRGISLFQPYTVLFVAEAYHGWYHSSSADVAGCILQQTIQTPPKEEQQLECRDSYDARSIYWLALCYWHLGEVNSVYALLNPLSIECEYILEKCDGDEPHALEESATARTKKALACGLWLLAMACTRLEKWQEAEDHLQALVPIIKQMYPLDESGSIGGTDMRQALKIDSSLYSVPLLADVWDLLGLICVRTNRLSQSETHSAEALERNPLLWSSCRRLCDQNSAQKLTQSLSATIDTSSKPLLRKKTAVAADQTPNPPSAMPNKPSMTLRQPTNQRPLSTRTRTAEVSDSAANTRAYTRLASRTAIPRSSSSNDSSTIANKAALKHKGAIARNTAPLVAKTPARTRASATAVSEKKRTRNGSTIRSATAARVRDPAMSLSHGTSNELLVSSVQGIRQLIKRSALATIHMASYRAVQALTAYSQLPRAQQNSAWGLCMLGRICFEAGRYPEAAQAFGEARRLAPYRVRDMDIYSTLLWHMKREEDLAQLAHSLVSVGRNWSPEAWIAVANCFSLDGDHQSAIKSLTRCIQLYKLALGGINIVPRNDAGNVGGLAYAHTLIGHESVAMDKMDRAQQAFRTAIRIDPRHYNAWYGLGMSYLRLGKADLAEYHFKRALVLNPQNPLLLQSAGAVYEHRKDYPQALRVYERVERMLNDGMAQRDVKGKAVEDKSETQSADEAVCGVSVADSAVILCQTTHHAMNFVMFKRARVLVVLERYTEAAVVLEQLLHRCPREFNVPFLLGQTYTKLRRFREAAACLTRALDIAPENLQSVREAFDALYLQDAEDREPDELDDMENSENSGIGASGHGYMQESKVHTPLENILTSSSEVGSPYFDSPSLYAGRRGHAEWRADWQSLGNADDRVDRALEFDV